MSNYKNNENLISLTIGKCYSYIKDYNQFYTLNQHKYEYNYMNDFETFINSLNYNALQPLNYDFDEMAKNRGLNFRCKISLMSKHIEIYVNNDLISEIRYGIIENMK